MSEDLDIYYSDCEDEEDLSEDKDEQMIVQIDMYKQIDNACNIYLFIKDYTNQNSLPICQNLTALHIYDVLLQ